LQSGGSIPLPLHCKQLFENISQPKHNESQGTHFAGIKEASTNDSVESHSNFFLIKILMLHMHKLLGPS